MKRSRAVDLYFAVAPARRILRRHARAVVLTAQSWQPADFLLLVGPFLAGVYAAYLFSTWKV